MHIAYLLFQFLIIASVLVDALMGYLFFSEGVWAAYGMVVRGGLFLLICFFFFLINPSFLLKEKFFVCIVLICTILFAINSEVTEIWRGYLYSRHMLYLYGLFGMVKILSVFIFIEILTYKRVASTNDFLFKMMSLIFLLYPCSIIVGYVFEIEWMNTYSDSIRPGVKGIVNGQNELAGLILMSGTWFVLRQVKEGKSALLPILLVITAGIIGSTKASIGVSLALFVFFLPFLLKNKKRIFYWFLLIGTAAAVAFNVERILEKESVVRFVNYFIYNFYLSGDILHTLLSGRLSKVTQILTEAFNSNPLHLFLGGYPAGGRRTEMDFIDVFLTFGPFGGIYILYRYWLVITRFSLKNDDSSSVTKRFGLIYMGIACLAGHILFSISLSIYLAVLIFYSSCPAKFSTKQP